MSRKRKPPVLDPQFVGHIPADMNDLIAEFEHVSRSTILFFRGLTPEQALHSGSANQAAITVRALGYVIAGHELHHMAVLRERYL